MKTDCTTAEIQGNTEKEEFWEWYCQLWSTLNAEERQLAISIVYGAKTLCALGIGELTNDQFTTMVGEVRKSDKGFMAYIVEYLETRKGAIIQPN